MTWLIAGKVHTLPAGSVIQAPPLSHGRGYPTVFEPVTKHVDGTWSGPVIKELSYRILKTGN